MNKDQIMDNIHYEINKNHSYNLLVLVCLAGNVEPTGHRKTINKCLNL